MLTEIKVPKSDFVNNISFIDLGIEPDFIIDHSNDPSYYNKHLQPVIRLQEKIYSETAYCEMNRFRERAKKEYEEWLSNAPWFVKIKEV